jgi:hypothetical protein
LCKHAFIFDPWTKDYLLVRFSIFSRKYAKRKKLTDKTTIAELYSVSRGYWETSSASFEEFIVLTNNGQRKTLFSGSVHFVA